MKESPAYEEIRNEGRVEAGRSNILANLEERFGTEAAEQVRADVETVEDLARLERLHRLSARCPDLGTFREALRAEIPSRRAGRHPSRRKR